MELLSVDLLAKIRCDCYSMVYEKLSRGIEGYMNGMWGSEDSKREILKNPETAVKISDDPIKSSRPGKNPLELPYLNTKWISLCILYVN